MAITITHPQITFLGCSLPTTSLCSTYTSTMWIMTKSYTLMAMRCSSSRKTKHIRLIPHQIVKKYNFENSFVVSLSRIRQRTHFWLLISSREHWWCPFSPLPDDCTLLLIYSANECVNLCPCPNFLMGVLEYNFLAACSKQLSKKKSKNCFTQRQQFRQYQLGAPCPTEEEVNCYRLLETIHMLPGQRSLAHALETSKNASRR